MPLFSRHWILDPSAPDQTPQIALELKGPALEVEISLPDPVAAILSSQGKPLPQPQIHTALIDTGASFTAVEEKILNALGLIAIDEMRVSTPGGQTPQKIFACKLSFPETPIPAISPIRVTGCKLEGFGHVALIGRDILRRYLLIYNGVDGHWTLAF